MERVVSELWVIERRGGDVEVEEVVEWILEVK